MRKTQAEFREDTPAVLETLVFNELEHPLWLHESVLDGLDSMDNLKRRLGLVMQHLAAHGRTGVVKGCSGENAGWRRTPLGGNGGNQFYLWWAPRGSPPLRDVNGGDGIYLRAVRHHDNHNKLSVGDLRAYFSLSQNEILDESEGYVSSPWTDNQLDFVSATSPVRVLVGRPGSGKTTALWRAVESRDNERVLYVSWSRELVNTSQEHFRAFAPSGVEVVPYDFVTLLGSICGYDARRLTYDQSLDRFRKILGTIRVGRDTFGPWADRESHLFAELRAVMLGKALPYESGSVTIGDWDSRNGNLWRLTDDEYIKLRSGNKGIGKSAARALVTIIDLIERRSAPELAEIFPEFVAASRAINELRNDYFPESLADIDRVVVDEIQDLTLVEITTLVELCLAISRQRGLAPWVLIAGDEGQTVRPSGFDWGLLKDVLNARLTKPQEVALDESVRYPRQIGQIIDRAQNLYATLDRSHRPANQQRQPREETLEAMVMYVEAHDRESASEMLEWLGSKDGLAVVASDGVVPGWVPENLTGAVLTPADVKGLEYPSVCVLNPGPLLKTLDAEINERDDAPELERHYRRTAIDQLRVALSRSTELLAFVDVEPDDAMRKLSQELLGDVASYSPDDLIDQLETADDQPEDRVFRLIEEARSLLDNNPRRAWERIVQSVKQLGDPGVPNGVADPTARSEAHESLLATAARLLAEGAPDGVRRDDVVGIAQNSLTNLGRADFSNAFRRLDEWTLDDSRQPFDLVDATIRLGDRYDWLRRSLPSIAQKLNESIEAHSVSLDYAWRFSGDVEVWLSVIGFDGETAKRARELRRKAAKALLDARRAEPAERVLARVEPEDLYLSGLLQETHRHWEKAVEKYERGKFVEDAMRVRMAGAEDYCDKGMIQLDASDPRSAISLFDSALRLNPDSGDAYRGRGVARIQRRQYGSALADYDRAIEINPRDVQAYRYRGYHHLYNRECGRAIDDFSQALDIDKNDVDTIQNRATAYLSMGQYDPAIKDFTRALEISPKMASAYNGRAIAYRARGNAALAQQDMGKARRLGLQTDRAASWYPPLT